MLLYSISMEDIFKVSLLKKDDQTLLNKHINQLIYYTLIEKLV